MADMVQKQGRLLKWTNYMKGFQERWFVLERGVLSYYRTREEMSHSCRGTLVLKDVRIEADTGLNFSVSSGARSSVGQSFSLRAHSDKERQEWITALELAKQQLQQMDNVSTSTPRTASTSSSLRPSRSNSSKGQRMDPQTLVGGPGGAISAVPPQQIQGGGDDSQSEDDELSEDESGGDPASNATLKSRMAAVQRCHEDLHIAVERLRLMITDLSEVPGVPVDEISELLSNVQRLSSSLLGASSDSLSDLVSNQKKWTRMLKFSDTKRMQLEESLEQLAQEHRRLERNANRATRKGALLSADEYVNSSEDEFFDAEQDQEEGEEMSTPMQTPRPSEKALRLPSTDSSGAEGKKTSPPKQKAAEAEAAAAAAVPTPSTIVAAKQFKRRTTIPPRTGGPASLWTILKNCIGKELSKIPMPVQFNEPLSFTQRLAEDLEYSKILDTAASLKTSQERMAYVAIFTVSSFANVTQRTAKPFNPLLGETFELDRRIESGWSAVLEQVSHHPPICCMYSESDKWVFWQEFSMISKFRGKYLEVTPTGVAHLQFKGTDDYYTWTKVPTTVHNVIVGKLWLDQHGTMLITNHGTGDTCELKYSAYSYFTQKENRRVVGTVMDKNNQACYHVNGTWDASMKCSSAADPSRETVVWTRNPSLPNHEQIYGFSSMACTLHEMSPIDEGCAPSDSRLRPDITIMENGEWDRANRVKVRLEEEQRSRRKVMEAKHETWNPVWFECVPESRLDGREVYRYKGGYWETKSKQGWKDRGILDLYNVDLS